MDIDILARGLVAGSLYALVAVSFNILYRPTNVFNFAQGELVMLGAMIFASLATVLGWPWYAALIITLVGVGLLTLLIDVVAVAPVLARSQHGTGWVITTLAASLIIANGVNRIWGPDPIVVRPPAPLTTDTFSLAGMTVSAYQIFLVLLTIILVLAIEQVYRTRQGKAVLAVAEDREAALLRGVNPLRLSRWSFFLGGAFAGLTAPVLYASTGLGPALLLKGFAAAAVGSIGNNRGALIAGYLIGVTEALGAALLSPGYQEAVVFLLVLCVLLVWPHGLFGRPFARTV